MKNIYLLEIQNNNTIIHKYFENKKTACDYGARYIMEYNSLSHFSIDSFNYLLNELFYEGYFKKNNNLTITIIECDFS